MKHIYSAAVLFAVFLMAYAIVMATYPLFFVAIPIIAVASYMQAQDHEEV